MEVPAVLKSSESFIWKYGLPLMGVGIGYAIGDVAAVATKIQSFAGQYIKDSKMANYLTAAIYLMVGIALWSLVPHIGGLIGGAFVGMAARTAMSNFGTQVVE